MACDNHDLRESRPVYLYGVYIVARVISRTIPEIDTKIKQFAHRNVSDHLRALLVALWSCGLGIKLDSYLKCISPQDSLIPLCALKERGSVAQDMVIPHL